MCLASRLVTELMAKAMSSWRQLHKIYGSDDSSSIISLAVQGCALGVSACACAFYFKALTAFLTTSFPFLPIQAWSFLAGLVGGLMALLSVCFLVTALNLWYCGLILRWKVAQRMVALVDWSSVYQALDVGCGSGILLNVVATQLKKERVGGRVVGVDLWLDGGDGRTMSSTLRNSAMEGVHEYVTCKSGDARNLPFMDDHFDVVLSALCLHKLGKEYGPRTSFATFERLKGLQEIVRVLKPGGQAIIWDLCHVPEYAHKLKEQNMLDVEVSECFPAFMMQSHILSFKKPRL